MCQGTPATLDSQNIAECWETKTPWDTRYARGLLDILEERYPNARTITLCVNGIEMAGRIKHG